MSKKIGLINSWSAARQIGTIICRDSNPIERYFLFGSRVIAGPEPYLNGLVLFDSNGIPPKPGMLPLALQVEVLGGTQ